MRINNIDVDQIGRTVEEMQADPSKARRTNRIEGAWNLEDGKPQFAATVKFEGGAVTVEADQPAFLGGGGARPGPMLYCLYGLASCYASTFAAVAAAAGVRLKGLKVVAESDINFSRSLGLSEAPTVEGVRIALSVDAEADRAKVEELEALARQRCPAVYCMTNAIPLTTTLQVG